MPEFAKLTPLKLKEVWPSESADFTPWLSENLQELGQVLGMDLEVVQREAGVGEFSLDILAKNLGDNHYVIVENQFGLTDHDHFGKILTYGGGYQASTIVWIAEEFRDEHRQALEWLNEVTEDGINLFGIELVVFKVEDSKPVFQFKPIITPINWPPKETNKNITTKGKAYKEFFQQLIDELRVDHHFTGAKTGSPQSWYSFPTGFSGITYGASFALKNRTRIEVYIDTGNAEINKSLFDNLKKDQNQIENEIKASLEWERLDEKRACRIALYSNGSIDDDDNKLVQIRKWMVDKLIDFKKTFTPYLKRITK